MFLMGESHDSLTVSLSRELFELSDLNVWTVSLSFSIITSKSFKLDSV
jgi:hypothetical protein